MALNSDIWPCLPGLQSQFNALVYGVLCALLFSNEMCYPSIGMQMEAPNFMKKVKPYKTVQNRTWQFKSSLPYPYENRTKPYISVHGLSCPEILLWLQNPASDLNENIGPSSADGRRFSGATALIFGCCALPIIFSRQLPGT